MSTSAVIYDIPPVYHPLPASFVSSFTVSGSGAAAPIVVGETVFESFDEKKNGTTSTFFNYSWGLDEDHPALGSWVAVMESPAGDLSYVPNADAFWVPETWAMGAYTFYFAAQDIFGNVAKFADVLAVIHTESSNGPACTGITGQSSLLLEHSQGVPNTVSGFTDMEFVCVDEYGFGFDPYAVTLNFLSSEKGASYFLDCPIMNVSGTMTANCSVSADEIEAYAVALGGEELNDDFEVYIEALDNSGVSNKYVIGTLVVSNPDFASLAAPSCSLFNITSFDSNNLCISAQCEAHTTLAAGGNTSLSYAQAIFTSSEEAEFLEINLPCDNNGVCESCQQLPVDGLTNGMYSLRNLLVVDEYGVEASYGQKMPFCLAADRKFSYLQDIELFYGPYSDGIATHCTNYDAADSATYCGDNSVPCYEYSSSFCALRGDCPEEVDDPFNAARSQRGGAFVGAVVLTLAGLALQV